jgi:hypothetical protein
LFGGFNGFNCRYYLSVFVFNDKLILDTDIALRGDITATNKVIGTVAGLEYTYTYSSQTLIMQLHYWLLE